MKSKHLSVCTCLYCVGRQQAEAQLSWGHGDCEVVSPDEGPELPVTAAASFYWDTLEQDREGLALVSSSLELSFLGHTHDLSLPVYVFIYNPTLKFCGASCWVEIRTVGKRSRIYMKHRNWISGQVALKGFYDGRDWIFINNRGPKVIGLVWIW